MQDLGLLVRLVIVAGHYTARYLSTLASFGSTAMTVKLSPHSGQKGRNRLTFGIAKTLLVSAAEPDSGGAMAGLVVKAHQLAGAERQRRVRLAGVVAEFDLVHARPKALDDGTDLSPRQPSFGDVLEQGNHREHFYFTHSKPPFNNTKQLVRRGIKSPLLMIRHCERSLAGCPGRV